MKPMDLEKLKISLAEHENTDSKKRLDEISLDYYNEQMSQRKQLNKEYVKALNNLDIVQEASTMQAGFGIPGSVLDRTILSSFASFFEEKTMVVFPLKELLSSIDIKEFAGFSFSINTDNPKLIIHVKYKDGIIKDFDATQSLINAMQMNGDVVREKINELTKSIIDKNK